MDKKQFSHDSRLDTSNAALTMLPNFFAWIQNFLLKVRKQLKINFLLENSLQNISYGHLECSFVRSPKKFRQLFTKPSFLRNFCSNSETVFKKLKKFYEKHFRQTYCLDIEMHFSHSCEEFFFLAQTPRILLKSSKNFSAKKKFRQEYSLDIEMLFSQTYQVFLAKVPKVSLLKVGKKTKI